MFKSKLFCIGNSSSFKHLPRIFCHLNSGEITEKGYQKRLGYLWDKYQVYLKESRQGNVQGRHLLSVIRLQHQPIRAENTLSLSDSDLDNIIRIGSKPESNLPWEKLGVFRKIKKVLGRYF